MAENVGSVEIKLLLDREDFDTELLALAETPPIEQRIRARLDLESFYEDLAVNGGQVGIGIDRKRFNEQLSQSLDDRSITAKARLDRNNFNTELDRLSSGSGAVSVGTDFDDRFDDRVLNQRIKNATQDQRIRFIGDSDFVLLFAGLRNVSDRGGIAATDIKRSFLETRDAFGNSLVPTIDESNLYKLNEHLSLKQKHWKEVRNDFSNPIEPDFSALELDRITRVRVSVDRSALENLNIGSIRSASYSPDFDGRDLRSAIDTGINGSDISQLGDAIKNSITRAGSAIGGTLTGVLTAPFKMVGGLASGLMRGALDGVGMALTKDLSSGFVSGLSGELSSIFGSFDLVGEKLGTGLGKTVSKPLEGLKPLVRDYISEDEATIASAAGRGSKRVKNTKKLNLAREQVDTEKQFMLENLPSITEYIKASREKRSIFEVESQKFNDEVQAKIELRTKPEREKIKLLEEKRRAVVGADPKKLPELEKQRSAILEAQDLNRYKDASPELDKENKELEKRLAMTNLSILEIIDPQKFKGLKADSLRNQIAPLQKRRDAIPLVERNPEEAPAIEAEKKTLIDSLNSEMAKPDSPEKSKNVQGIKTQIAKADLKLLEISDPKAALKLKTSIIDADLNRLKARLKIYSGGTGRQEDLPALQALLSDTEKQLEVNRRKYQSKEVQVENKKLISKASVIESKILEITNPEKSIARKTIAIDSQLAAQRSSAKEKEKQVKDEYAPQSAQFSQMEKQINEEAQNISRLIGSSSEEATIKESGYVIGRGTHTRDRIAQQSKKVADLRSAYSKASKTLEKHIKLTTSQMAKKYDLEILKKFKKIEDLKKSLETASPESIEGVEQSILETKNEIQILGRQKKASPRAVIDKHSEESKYVQQIGKELASEESNLSRMRRQASTVNLDNIGISDYSEIEKIEKKEGNQYKSKAQKRAIRKAENESKPKEYLELAKIVMGKDFDEAKLPRVILATEEESKNDIASYTPGTNTIKVRAKEYQELQSSGLLSRETSNTIAEELAHAYDMDFGSEKGLRAFAQGRVANQAAVPTMSEMAAIAPELSQYGDKHRQIEMSGKTRALRAEEEYAVSRGQAYHNTEVTSDIGIATKIERNVERQKKAIEKMKMYASMTGRESDEILSVAMSQVEIFESKGTQLKSQAVASLNPENPRINTTFASQIVERQSDLSKKIAEKTSDYQALAVVQNLPTPEIESLKRDSSVLVGAQRQAGLKDSAEMSKEVRTEIKAIEAESIALEKQKSEVTPSTAKSSFAALKAKSDDLASRRKEVEDAINLLKGEVNDADPKALEKAEKRVALGEAAKAKTIEVGQKAKAGASRIKEAVFNKDRNIDIDVDSVRDGVEATGKALYAGGLAAAKTLDTVATGFKALAASDVGQKVLGAAGGTANAMVATTKAMYKIASAAESVALDLVPMGRSAKGLLKQTAVPALAYSAATHMLPGGAAVAGGLEHLATGLLSPVMHGGGSALSGQASSVISQIVPNVMGLQSSVVSAATGLIEGAMNGAIAPIASAATAVIGGKFLTGSAGNAVKALPFVGATPSNQALPAGKTIALPPSTGKTEQTSVVKALPVATPKPTTIDIAKQEQSLREELAYAEKTQDIDRYTATSKKLTSLVSQKQESAIAQKQEEQSQQVKAPIVEVLPPSPLESLTKPQLYAVAKQEGVKGVNSATKKDALISKIQQKVPTEKIDSIVQNIDQNFDRKGQPIGGFDKDKEKDILAQIKIQEKAINKKIAAAKKLGGHEYIKAIEEMERDAQSFVAQLDMLQMQVFSPKTSGVIGSTKGRVEASIRHKPETIEARDNRIAATNRAKAGPTYGASYAEMVEQGRGYREPAGQTIDVVPTRLARAASPRSEGLIEKAKRRMFGLVSDPTAQSLAATGASMIAGPIGDGIHPIAGTAARLGASRAVKIASLVKPEGEGLVPQAKAFIQSDKAKGMAAEAVIAASGMLASSALSGQGSIASNAASLVATLTTRVAIEAGTQYKTSIDKLRKQEEFINAGIKKKAKMLADAAKEINLSKSGDALTGDISGFAIGNAATYLKGAIATATGIPAINQLPIDAIASTVLPGKVVDARRSFVARASEPKGEGLLAKGRNFIEKAKDRISTIGINKDRLNENFGAIRDTYAMRSGGTAIGSLAPRLEIADKELKSIGADALYDVDRNVVMVSRSLAKALSSPAQSLDKVESKLKPLIHELRHSNQFKGGTLDVEQAASGMGVRMRPNKAEKILSADQIDSVNRSVDISAKQNPSLNKKSLRDLEVDAYAAESHTLDTIKEMQALAAPQHIGLIDRLSMLGSRAKSFVSRKPRKDIESIEKEVSADAVYAETSKREKSGFNQKEETKSLDDFNVDYVRAKNLADAATSKFEATETRILQEPETIKNGFIQRLTSGRQAPILKRRTSALPKGFKADTSEDAETMAADAIAGFENASSRYSQVEDSINLKYDAILNGEEAKKEFGLLSRLLGRPIPNPFAMMSDGTKDVLNGVRRLGMGLAALPFAIGGFGVAIGMMQKFASVSVEAA
ncbi:MAG: hypothetical protein ACRC62_20995, partial [Microcoleus sp.]